MSAFRQGRLLNTIGAIVLLIGLGSAGLVYRLGLPRASTSIINSDWTDSSLALTDSKNATHDIELYGGKVEVLMVKWLAWVHRPASQAILIATTSVVVALICYLIAHYFETSR